MKKFAFLSIFLLFAAGFFTNCSKDATTIAGPTIAFANNKISTEIDFSVPPDPFDVLIAVTIQAEGKIDALTIKKQDFNGASIFITPTVKYSGETSYTETFTISCASTEAYPLKIIFSITDKDAKGMEKTYTITKKTSSGFAFTKSGMFYHIEGLLQGAYDLDGDALVAAGGASSTKSMKNVDVAGNAFTGSWTSDNGTLFVKALGYPYTTANATSAATAYAAGSALTSVTAPADNDIYIAKKGATYYAIKVLTVDPAFSTGTGNNTGKITFEYKKD